jgi:hypothetical protein
MQKTRLGARFLYDKKTAALVDVDEYHFLF